MKFKPRGIRNAGDIEKERLVIDILEDGNLGELFVASTSQQGEHSISSRLQNTYWIPDQSVKKGDMVVVYTKKGQKNHRENEESSSYFFYIGLDEPLYLDNNETAVVFDIADWQSFSRDNDSVVSD